MSGGGEIESDKEQGDSGRSRARAIEATKPTFEALSRPVKINVFILRGSFQTWVRAKGEGEG